MKEVLYWDERTLRVHLVEHVLKFQPIFDRDAWTDKFGYGYYVLEQGDLENLMGLERQALLPNPVRNILDAEYLERKIFGHAKPSYQFMYATIVNKLAMLQWKREPFLVDPNYLAISFIPEMRARACALYLFTNEYEIIESLEELI